MVDKNTQAQHWKNKSYQIVDSYFTSPPAIKRSKWLCEQLKGLEFKSVLEIGSFAGRNLYYLHQTFPDVTMSGLEINPMAVKYAREKVPGVSFIESDLHNLDNIVGSWDLVFTSGVLIHQPPQDVKTAIEQMLRKATKYLIHLEEIGPSELVACPDKKLKPKYKISDQWQWNVDLISIYENLGYKPSVMELSGDIKTNGAKEMVVIKL